jgi:hypothetical protein
VRSNHHERTQTEIERQWVWEYQPNGCEGLMSNKIPRTAKRMSRIKAEAANQFDVSLLHYRVFHAPGDTGCIGQFVDVVKKVYQLEESKAIYTDDVRQTAFSPAEELNSLTCVVYCIKRFVKQ